MNADGKWCAQGCHRFDFPAAISLKLADRMANTRRAEVDFRDKFSMYSREYPSFRGALRDFGGNWNLWDALDERYGWKS